MPNEELKDKMDSLLKKAKEIADEAGKKTGEYAKIFGDKAGEYAKIVGDKAADVIDAAKTKVEIEKMEYAANKKLRELGKTYYTSKKDGSSFDDTAMISDLDTLYEAIKVLKEGTPDENLDASCCDCSQKTEE